MSDRTRGAWIPDAELADIGAKDTGAKTNHMGLIAHSPKSVGVLDPDMQTICLVKFLGRGSGTRPAPWKTHLGQRLPRRK